MNRKTVLEELLVLETQMEIAVKMKKDLSSIYFKDVQITAHINSTDFDKKYTNEKLDVDKKIFIAFIDDRIAYLNNTIHDKLNGLN